MKEKYPQFKKTKELYEAATPYVRYPLTYAEWLELPEEVKASALFVTFYNQIMYIVNRMDNYTYPEETKITYIVTRLLNKVDSLKRKPQLYKTTYICEWTKQAIIERGRQLWDNEYRKHCVSVITEKQDLDNTDFITNIYDITESDEEYEPLTIKALHETRDMMEDLLRKNDPDLTRTLYILINGKKPPIRFKRKYYMILAELRKMFAKQGSYFKDIHLDCDTFEDVINNEDLILNAIVMFPDGEEGVYFGDKQKLSNHITRYTFMCRNGERHLSRTKASKLKVIEVETID